MVQMAKLRMAEAGSSSAIRGLAGCPPGGYAAGPVASVTVAVWDWPEPSVQAMATLSPGW